MPYLSYRYRLLPNKAQHGALERILEDQRVLYNAALEERIDCYRKTGRGRTYVDQCKALTLWRSFDATARSTPLKLQRWTLSRLDAAFRSFFRRVAADAIPGFPRFRGKSRWRSFGFTEMEGIRWDGKRLRIAGIPGGLRVHLHRPLQGDLKNCVFTRGPDGWSISFQSAFAAVEKRPVEKTIGVDMGLVTFAHTSDGDQIPNPHVARRRDRQIKRRSRALARCLKTSKRRQKVKRRLSKCHRRIENARSTWLHQQSSALVARADLIAAEDLNIAGLLKNPHASRSIADASWGRFLSMVAYKAERAGKHFILVKAKNTSQECSGCGMIVAKSRRVREHSCPHCGLILDRDHNAAKVILARAVARPEAANPAKPDSPRKIGPSKRFETLPGGRAGSARGAT